MKTEVHLTDHEKFDLTQIAPSHQTMIANVHRRMAETGEDYETAWTNLELLGGLKSKSSSGSSQFANERGPIVQMTTDGAKFTRLAA